MKTIALTFLTALAFVLPARADKLDQWYKLLPKNTLGVISIKDARELTADWQKGGFAKMMEDPEFKKWVAPGMKDGELAFEKGFKEDVGESMGDFLKRFQGSVMIAIAADSPEDFKDVGGPAVALIEVGDQEAKIDELWQHNFESEIQRNSALKKITKDIGGATVQILAESDAPDAEWKLAHTFVDGVMILGVRESMFEHFIPALKTGTADSSEVVTGHLTRLAEQSEGNADITIYANAETLMKWMENSLSEATKNGQKAAMPIDPSMIISALGVAEFQSLGFMIDFSETQSRVDMAILHPEKLEGILSLMQGGSTEVNLPAFIPADALSGQVTNQSLGAIYDGLLAMVGKLGPMAMMATMQISQMEQQLGFKIKEDLFASLEEENVQIVDGSALDQRQVIGLKVKDRARLGGALDGLKRFIGQGFGAFEDSEFLGHTISLFKATAAQAAPGAKSTEIAYCLTDDYLFFSIGQQDLLKKVLTRLKEAGEPSIWDAPRTQELMAMMPKGYSSVGVSDASKQINLILEAMSTVQKQTGGSKKKPSASKSKGPKGEGFALPEADSFFDSKAQPSEEMFKKYFGTVVSGGYAKPGALHWRMLSKPVEAAQ
ncbi:MAG: hypothetical protein NTV80_23855 [Verrucomicrobia bacterium]|nr:hypothetical protein [Verrucomicrobiota bacterium]